ncbi:MAG: ArsR family transcriptional regulator [Verrucomicrobiota bacterium]|nr:ArsR family transcriptional regulator [Chthoniobacterales bacterium]MDQ3415403.1 ArsR family transcriptional regulator [Verrucomicrobiota bacterium]
MKSQRWRQRILETTRGQILSLLRVESRTVNELAAALELTDNAVRAHLISLERDGLIQQEGSRPGLRKPHAAYGLTSDAEQIFPKAYGVVLNHLISSISKRLSLRELRASMREVGRTLAREQVDQSRLKSRQDRLVAAQDLVKKIGGAAAIHETNGQILIRGKSCPLAATTAGHPEACLIIEGLLTEIIGGPVKQRCTLGSSPSCCFELG